ncbi:MAG: carboxypeptidase-like regulatory domain-containing protein, partial [bacterium]
MKLFFSLSIIFFLSQNGFSQQYEVSGTIFDAKTGKPLEYVTIKVADTTLGTTADKNGKYFIRMKPGGNKLIFSYIGYKTDTSNVYIEDKNIVREIFLTVSEIMTDAIEVYGEDPAYEI